MLSGRMESAKDRILDRRKQQFVGLTAKLDALSPLKVLTRGYAMMQLEDGQVVRSVTQTKVGDYLTVTLADGHLHATVMDHEVKKHE